ncbi:VOC family protein, partial [Ralstonia pseudosolanacearum]|uniref:VOC family protein n=1 Tax=Ralstonia pseudosolanacearum TaxID=1310165 RepID=UPI003CE785BA
MLTLDHLAVACRDLAEGMAWVEAQLGVRMQPGGKHLRYGTHNTLLGLGDDLYLEVIAKDPGAAAYDGPAWFGLDHFSGPPRLGNWICQSDDLASAPEFVGLPQALARGDLSWQITVPEDGSLPYGGAYP